MGPLPGGCGLGLTPHYPVSIIYFGCDAQPPPEASGVHFIFGEGARHSGSEVFFQCGAAGEKNCEQDDS